MRGESGASISPPSRSGSGRRAARHTRRATTVTSSMQPLRSAIHLLWPVLLAVVVTLLVMIGLPMVLAAAS